LYDFPRYILAVVSFKVLEQRIIVAFGLSVVEDGEMPFHFAFGGFAGFFHNADA
jgi:hypothetical protein